MANLFMAVVWLVIGVGLLTWQYLHPENHDMTIRGTGISFGWLPFLLVLYNLARWFIDRSNFRGGRVREELDRRDRPPSTPEPQRPAVTPDPNFNFTDEPPPPRD
jgi:hypothetical protein